METKVSYAMVGAFVLVLSLAIVIAVLWISSGRATRKDSDTYLAYFTESVSGLNRQAPVKYKGVEVGSVREVGLDPGDPQRVQLVLAIDRGVPIKQDTVAVLSVQGLTGIAFLDLEGGSRDSPLLAPKEAGGYPVISTRPSLLRRLDTEVSALVADVSQTARSINVLLDEETRAALRRAIHDFESVVHAVAGRSKAIEASLVDGARTMEHGARASERLAQVVEQIGRSADAVERAASETARAGDAVRSAAGDASGGLAQLRAETLPELGRLIAEARTVTASLGRVTQQLERNPSALVVGRGVTPLGPGE
ncbi:MAG: MCE family protein [Deltaproteobacteria bacterium]|nr:MCE family protein [Deltaproteobacteria bacterium]